MALPQIDYPISEIYLKSLDRNVKFRPFLVREEKLFLIAKESKDPDDIKNAVLQIISNCCLEDLDVTKIPLFDIEMIFIKLRALSIGESVQLEFHCKNEVDGKECDTTTPYTLNLDKVKYVMPENISNKVMLTDKVGVKLKYPDLGISFDVEDEDNLYDVALGVLFNNVECIFDEENVYKPEEYTEKEFEVFVESLTLDKMREIQNFFSTAPRVVLEDEVECRECGFKHTIHSEDLLSFFI
jgi:hypothetical protein